MKRILFSSFILGTVLVFGSLSPKNDDGVAVESKDTKLPDWQWTSGEVPIKKTAAKQCFTIAFSPKIYHPRDSVKITFTSYKVSITGLNKGTTFKRWTGNVSLVYYININWIPLVVDTNDRINQLFTGKNNNPADSLINYSVWTRVPLSRTLTITTSALSFEMDEADGHGHPISTNGAPTFTTSIKGIEVKKLE
jgi:hypothetical protein